MNMKYILSIIYGITFPYLLNYFNGNLIGNEAINYYGEVHLSFWNSLIHTIFMPITIYGMLLWIPAVFTRRKCIANEIQLCMYLMYMSHYIFSLNFIVGICIAFYYLQPLNYGMYTYGFKYSRLQLFIGGICISTTALVIQEVVGHYIGGDNLSRFEAIPNAIMYAMYYSISHLLRYINIY